MTTTEARAALAEAMAATEGTYTAADTGWLETWAEDILAALDGWTLVPVDTVAALFWFHEMVVQGGPDGSDLDQAVSENALAAAAAVRAALGASDDE